MINQAMKPFSLIVVALFAMVAGAAAVRMLALAARTRKAPELLLGLSMLLPLAGFATMVAAAAIGGAVSRDRMEVGGVIIDLGYVAVAGFVWLVFRRDERWALALAVALALAGLAMPVANHFLLWAGRLPPTFLPRAILRNACDLWAAIEALRYAHLMRKRVRFGLAEPLVADRFRLWGVAHLTAAVMLDGFTLGAMLWVQRDASSEVFTWTGAGFGLCTAILFTLSFFPPAVYVRRVEYRATAEVSS
jgi:hypothetical protein